MEDNLVSCLKIFLNEVFCEAGGENQPRLIKVGVDSLTKKRWGDFQNPYEGNLLKPPRFLD